MPETRTTEPQPDMFSVEPIPIFLPTSPEGEEVADAGLLEAFRQGWLSARHWPNHPLPSNLRATVEEIDADHVTLTIEWWR